MANKRIIKGGKKNIFIRKVKMFFMINFAVLIIGGVFVNTSFYSGKVESVYSSLKEEYGIRKDEAVKADSKEKPEAKEEADEEAPKEAKGVTSRHADSRNREQYVWDYLRNSGYSKVQTSAIIGNLYQESGLDPEKVEYGTKEGIGIVQWSFGRKAQLMEFAKSKGKEWVDLDVQLEFLVSELKGGKQFFGTYKSTFENPYSVSEATEAYCFGFERPNRAKANLANRQKQAWATYYRNEGR